MSQRKSSQHTLSQKPEQSPRFLVGIDLGTTNTVVAYTDLSSGLDQIQPGIFEIEQLVAPGEVARKPLLPCFRYHPAKGELYRCNGLGMEAY